MGTRLWKAAALGLLALVVLGAIAVIAYNVGVADSTPTQEREVGEAWRGYGHPFWGGWFFFPVLPLLFAVLFIFVVSGVIRSAWFGGARGWHGGDLEDWHRHAHEDPTNAQTPEDAARRNDS